VRQVLATALHPELIQIDCISSAQNFPFAVGKISTSEMRRAAWYGYGSANVKDLLQGTSTLPNISNKAVTAQMTGAVEETFGPSVGRRRSAIVQLCKNRLSRDDARL
jgi:hypothetical protein